MKFTSIAICMFAIAFASNTGCKKAEKKRRGDDKAATDTPKPTEATDPTTVTKPPQPNAANPHAKAPNPHAKAPAAPPRAKVGATAEDGTKVLGPFSIKVPKGWKETPATSSMRLAQWSVGDKDPGELVLFNFPGGGSVDANINRWVGQFTQEDGSSSADKAVRKDETISGLPVTTLSISGRYTAAVTPGAAAKHNKAAYRMLAAIVSVNGSAYFFKMIGPKTTLDAAENDWNALVKSITKL